MVCVASFPLSLTELSFVVVVMVNSGCYYFAVVVVVVVGCFSKLFCFVSFFPCLPLLLFRICAVIVWVSCSVFLLPFFFVVLFRVCLFACPLLESAIRARFLVRLGIGSSRPNHIALIAGGSCVDCRLIAAIRVFVVSES